LNFVLYNGQKLSKLSLGTVQFGLNYGINNTSNKASQEEANNIVKFVTNNGVNCFDTAQAYGNSEEVLGDSNIVENEAFIISKLKSSLFINNCMENVSISLKKLNIKSLYGLLLHDSKLLYSWNSEYSFL
jgi:aryl-alcohol dehydrogenase-like predicted oxidoreductase